MDGLKSWWADASARDQIALLLLTVFVFIFIVFQFIYFPVSDLRSTQERSVEAQRQAYERVKRLSDEWIAHEANKANTGRQSAGIEKTIQASFGKHELRVSDFDASGRGGIRIRFESVKFEKFVAWLNDIEVQQGFKMRDISVAGSSKPGLISASILIQKT